MNKNSIFKSVENNYLTHPINSKGITLVALVITIIILIILSGISINLILGENGLIEKARTGAKNYEDASKSEQSLFDNITEFINSISDDKGSSSSSSTPSSNRTLLSQITPSDYGKSINYSVNVTDQTSTDNPKAKITLNNWKVFYKDENNVYIILDDYLESKLAPTATHIIKVSKYVICYEYNNDENDEKVKFLNYLSTTSNWQEFTKTIQGNVTTATGTPTAEQLFKSLGTDNTGVYTVSDSLSNYSLYIPHTDAFDDCYGYWLASLHFINPESDYIRNVRDDGDVSFNFYDDDEYGIRPVVCLPSNTTGTVGTTVTID